MVRTILAPPELFSDPLGTLKIVVFGLVFEITAETEVIPKLTVICKNCSYVFAYHRSTQYSTEQL